MTAAADLLLTNAEVHTLADPDETYEAVAVRDGAIVRVDDASEAAFLAGVDTTVIDLDGRVLLPGFVDAHTHLPMVGRYRVHADLRGAAGPEECLDRLREADDGEGWILGFGFDESAWDESRYLTRADLDRVSDERPVAAFREDMHVAAVNGVALDRHRDAMPDGDVRDDGVLVEGAVDPIRAAAEPDRDGMRDLVLAARRAAHERGVTGVHDMVRRSRAPAVYRDLDREDDLGLRVRLNYWHGHLDAVIEAGLCTNHGSAFVRTGAIKAYADGSLGGRTAKLSEPYADGEGAGQWVVGPEELRDLVERADAEGFQVATHAIGDAAVDAVLDAYGETAAGAARHRIEHAELTADDAIERLADLGAVASVQPNFLKWAGEGGLYDRRLGARRTRTNRYRDLLDAGVPLAFGSDCMPLDPLFGIHRTVNAPVAAQRLDVTEALRAYTRGAAYAGFDEGRLGTIAPGKRADLVALERSPWEHPGAIEDIDVALTVVDGDVVYRGR